MLLKKVLTVTLLLVTENVLAHPGEHEAEERAALLRRGVSVANRRALNLCATDMERRGIAKNNALRRHAKAKKLVAERELARLKLVSRSNINASSVLAKDHNMTTKYPNLQISTPESTFFKEDGSCVLVPEVTQGPYWVQGEYVRSDIREDQEGVDLYMDLQIVDVSTCKPMPGVWLDVWHANSTGVYSGVSAAGNGVSDEDGSNLNSTFLRGVGLTDASGVADMTTLVPGHYTGRTNHIHVIVHQHGGMASNLTYVNGTISHVGQMFFDQTLLTAVGKTSPYSENDQEQTKNADDMIFTSEADGYDPMLNYVYLGDSVADGLFVWTTIGINASASYDDISPAAYWTSDGGVESDSGIGGPPGVNGTMPTGAAPSGALPSGGAGGPPSGAVPSGAMPSGTPPA